MPEMPSANVCSKMSTSGQVKGPDFNISSRDMEGLVMEIKENLRLSAPISLKAGPCSHISRKSSRASPYRIPGTVQFHQGKFCCDSSLCEASSTSGFCIRKGCCRKSKLQDSKSDDPYELLQKLLKDGSLVSEAVRRVQLGMTPKQRYFYDSEDDNSPVLRLYPQET